MEYHVYGALVRVPTAMIEECFGLGTLCLVRSMEVEPLLALVAMTRVAKVGGESLPHQEWFPYDYTQGMRELRPEEVRRLT